MITQPISQFERHMFNKAPHGSHLLAIIFVLASFSHTFKLNVLFSKFHFAFSNFVFVAYTQSSYRSLKFSAFIFVTKYDC